MDLEQLGIYTQNKKVKDIFHNIYKNYLKIDHKPKIIKFLKEKWENLCDPGLIFLDEAPKAWSIKGKRKSD